MSSSESSSLSDSSESFYEYVSDEENSDVDTSSLLVMISKVNQLVDKLDGLIRECNQLLMDIYQEKSLH